MFSWYRPNFPCLILYQRYHVPKSRCLQAIPGEIDIYLAALQGYFVPLPRSITRQGIPLAARSEANKFKNKGVYLMSVLKAHRSESKAEFVNVANKIYIQAVGFLSRLSSRYSRLVSKSVSELASEVVNHAEKANSIYPSDATRKELRKQHLIEARASLMALDVHLAHCYDLMMTNPSGCFTTVGGSSVDASKAKKKLEHMAQELGDLIDAENVLLTNVLKSDKSR